MRYYFLTGVRKVIEPMSADQLRHLAALSDEEIAKKLDWNARKANR
jgi:hypothetical protein